MIGQNFLQTILKEKLAEIRYNNPSYSLRAFAKKLNVSSSSLSEILKNKRIVSSKIADKILSKLNVQKEIKASILNQIEYDKIIKAPQKRKNRLFIDYTQSQQISKWYHYAILALIDTEDFKSDPAWIAKRFGLTTSEVKDAINLLEKMELIKKDNSGNLFKSKQEVWYKGPQNRNLRFIDFLDYIKQLIFHETKQWEGGYITITMAIDPEKIPEAKKMMISFRDRLKKFLDTGKKKEVFGMGIMMFPFSGLEKPKKEIKE